MADKSHSGRSSKRAQLARGIFAVDKWRSFWLDGLTWQKALIGVGMALAVTLLLQQYNFQNLPRYEIGDIAGRTIVAPKSFVVTDLEATEAKQQETLKTVPAVFNLDLLSNQRIEAELRSGFARGREILLKFREERELAEDAALSKAQRAELLDRLKEALPRFNRGELLPVLLEHDFSAELENQVVRLLQRAMKHPGVTASREVLHIYQDRGIILYNNLTKQDEPLKDWIAVRDLSQARDLLRQNQYELTALSSGEEKRKVIDFLDNWVVPNVHFNEKETQAREELAMQEESPVMIQFKKGRTIVRPGDEITAQDLVALRELAESGESGQPLDRFVGGFLLSLFLVFALWQYFLIYLKGQQRQPEKVFLMIGLILLLQLSICRLLVALSEGLAGTFSREVLREPQQYYFLLPVALGAFLIVLLLDAQSAILYSLGFSALVILMTGQASIGIYAMVGNLAAIYSLRQYRERSAIVRAGLLIACVNILTILSLQLYSSVFDGYTFAVRAVGGFLGGLFTAMLASVLLPALEWLFEITTDIRLLELSNLNQPILRRLAVEAPGTYHHSILVGTLAEAAAEAIGANSLLARVGAYYHDIGKMRKPEYYVENQIFMANKHEGLAPSMSSLILASHVKDGLAIAREINLTPRVRDLIPQHHGTKLMAFFYQKAKRGAEEKNQEINEEDFRYPGPKPQSKEAAILMLADQVEAASRTLQEPSPRQVRALIRRLIQSTIEDRQFDECEITTRDLDLITRAFERVITGMYHHRVEYPGFDFNREVVDSQPLQHQRIQ